MVAHAPERSVPLARRQLGANRTKLVLAIVGVARYVGRDVTRELRRVAKDEGCNVVIVSHDQRLKDIADRVRWLKDGRFSGEDGLVTDPVCGMTLERRDARHSLEIDGETDWSCWEGCQKEYAQQARARSEVTT